MGVTKYSLGEMRKFASYFLRHVLSYRGTLLFFSSLATATEDGKVVGLVLTGHLFLWDPADKRKLALIRGLPEFASPAFDEGGEKSLARRVGCCDREERGAGSDVSRVFSDIYLKCNGDDSSILVQKGDKVFFWRRHWSSSNDNYSGEGKRRRRATVLEGGWSRLGLGNEQQQQLLAFEAGFGGGCFWTFASVYSGGGGGLDLKVDSARASAAKGLSCFTERRDLEGKFEK